MLSENFTLLDLTDLALKIPEVGAVNFNILYTVITNIILELKIDSVKVPCHVEDEVLAQTAITKSRMEGRVTRRPSKVETVEQMKEKLKTVKGDRALEKDPSLTSVKEKLEQVAEKFSDEEETAKSKESVTEKIAKQESETQVSKDIQDALKETVAQIADDDEAEEFEGDDASKEDIVQEESEISDKTTKQESETEISRDIQDALKEAVAQIAEDEEMEEVEGDDATKEDIVQEESEIAVDLDELKEIAQDLMQAGADDLAKTAEAVTEALQVLQDEDILEQEPAEVIQELWKSININRRMDALELTMKQFSSLIDSLLDKIMEIEEESADIVNKTKHMFQEIAKFPDRLKDLEETCRILGLRIEDSNEKRASEVERLEEIINEMTTEQEDAKSAIEAIQGDLAEKVVYKAELEDARQEMSEEMKINTKEIKKLIREVEDSLVRKDDFEELVSRVEQLEDEKVSRDELGRLLEPGFIDNFLDEQLNLRTELNELKEKVSDLEGSHEALKTMVEEDVIKVMAEKFAEIHAMLDTINAKLSLLDPDEINDSFANLEEQVEMIKLELGELKTSYEQFQKEAKINFNKISNVSEWLNRLEQTKMDKSKLYELLEKKADIDLIMGKVDKNEFAIVMGNFKDDLDRLSIQVTINEETMNDNFTNVNQDLALKMYTEDFITLTEPIRNRIKALIYELRRVKEIALTHLFPDAPGIAKCISCNRGAHLAGPKFAGDASIEFVEDTPPDSHVRMAYDKSSKPDVEYGENSGMSLSLTDLDSVPIPDPDKPREKDPKRLPLLLASARPNIGLAHEMRRRTIDKKLAAYFSKKPVRSIDGQHTRTEPQQRGVSFTPFQLSEPEKTEVLLKGTDKSIYRGTVYDDMILNDKRVGAKPPKKTSGKRDAVLPSVVRLQNATPLSKASSKVLLPSNLDAKKTRSKKN